MQAHCLHLLALFCFLVFSVSTNPILLARASTIHLIHRHSHLSPFHDPSKTHSQHLQNAAFRSRSRSKRLSFQTDVVPSLDDPDGDYMMRIYVGTPSIQTWAIADTGSDLVWFQCLPCHTCYPQNLPIFNPKKSSSYKKLTCHSKPCSFLPQNYSSCGSFNKCVYFYDYGDKSTTMGDLAVDYIDFGGRSGHFIHHKTVFGCGHNNTGKYGKSMAGIVGLGNGNLSLISQLGPKIDYKFSYCLVPFFSNSSSKLKLGANADIFKSKEVVSTPFIHVEGVSTFYILDIEGIIVGGKTALSKVSQSESGLIVIDSGTSGTSIATSFYNRVEALVKEAIGVEYMENPAVNFNLCFKNESVVYNKINRLNFVVNFKGSAKVSLKSQNIFVAQDDNLLCFAIFPTDGLPIYGNLAQVDFEVEYDLKHNQISFAPTDCTKN